MRASRFKTSAVLFAVAALAAAGRSPAAPTDARASSSSVYRKLQLSDQFFCEGATFGDLNRDGHADAIAGPYWYEGPDFAKRHELYPPGPFDPRRYSDNFLAFTHDFNGDGWLDVLVLGFPGVDASWYENPGKSSLPWRRHVVYLPVDNESPTFGDLLGNGQPVLMCTSGGRLGYATWNPKDPARPWTFHAVSPPGKWERYTHGLGYGDVNGDGRADLLEKDGWWEQPASLDGDPLWRRHPVKFTGPDGGAQILVYDVNGDGLNDVISSREAHSYGLSWFEQIRRDAGEISFREHVILSAQPDEKLQGVQFSQVHAVTLADFDGDGALDILAGKRWWAHGPKGDPEPNAAPVIYAFLLRRAADRAVRFEPRLIDDASGAGVQLVATDVNGDARPDIISANKRGTFVFLSEQPK
jgi:hypothetical protein